ncbi:MAG: VCBS domain-containing protein [Pararhodobacter sp.]|nr:VCBS domain-containing protein [Pararhodobacter sp.]
MTAAHGGGAGDGSVWSSGTGSAWPNRWAFAALKDDGAVVTWGSSPRGGDQGVYSISQFTGVEQIADVSDQLQGGVSEIYTSGAAFAALKDDGAVVTWGDAAAGGDSGDVADDLAAGVVAVYSTDDAFAALKDDGSVVTWGNGSRGGNSSAVADDLSAGVVAIHATQMAFAAIKADGAIITWGLASWGGNSSAVADDLAGGVVTIHATERAFAALKDDGSVVTWGVANYGGDASAVSDALEGGVTALYSTQRAFAALKADGSVITWGAEGFGGDSSAVADALQGDVVGLHATLRAFAALKADGSVVTWGDADAGGDSSAVADALQDDVVALYSTRYAFAALKADGSVVAWGQSPDDVITTIENWGGDPGPVSDQLENGVVQVFSTASAFAALKEDGSVVTWGADNWGGDSSPVSEDLSSGVVTIYATQYAFAAVKEDGSVVSWGAGAWGGDSSAVADQLSGGVVALAAPFRVKPLNPAVLAARPAARGIGAVAGDDVIDVTEAAEGIAVTGTAEPGASVSVRLSDILAASATADDTGNWQVVFTPESQLDLGAHTIFATANVGGLSSAVASRDVTVVAPPLALVIDRVAGNNVITPDEAAEGLVITGSAAPGAEVAVTFGDFAQTTNASPDGAWRVSLTPQQIPEPGDHFVLARATLDGTASPQVGRRVSVVEPPSAPEIAPVGVDDVIAPGDLDFGLDMRGLADPGARVTVSFGDITQTVMASAEGMVTGGWEALFDLEDLPPAGEHLVTAQAARDGLFSDVTERLVTIENTPAQIFGDTTGQVIEGAPAAEQDRGTLLVLDRDAGEDRFQAPDPQDLETLFGAFHFDPLTGNWMFTLDNGSPAVQAMTDGEEATVGLTVTSQDGTASETITITITGAGVADPDPTGPYMLAGQIIDRAQEGLPGAVIYFAPDEGEMLAFGTDLDGNFSLELPADSSGLLAPIRDYDEFDPSITAASALETLRLSVGLDPSWGPADAMDFIAADYLGNGAVTALDALEILRVSVGLEAEMPPRWLFLDADADLSHIDRQNTVVDTGRVVDPLIADTTDLALVGILVGHVQAVPIITES